jgi:2-methylisocitrate lyase-like PEP mutase family enzyme
VLPNAWDVPSALAYLEDGFTAVGTTSFGVASSGATALPPASPHAELQARLVDYEKRLAAT